jgi:hypothetical protein
VSAETWLRRCPQCHVPRPWTHFDAYLDAAGCRRVEGVCRACVEANVRDLPPPPYPDRLDHAYDVVDADAVCTATTAFGRPCSMPAADGTDRCHWHSP